MLSQWCQLPARTKGLPRLEVKRSPRNAQKRKEGSNGSDVCFVLFTTSILSSAKSDGRMRVEGRVHPRFETAHFPKCICLMASTD